MPEVFRHNDPVVLRKTCVCMTYYQRAISCPKCSNFIVAHTVVVLGDPYDWSLSRKGLVLVRGSCHLFNQPRINVMVDRAR